MSVTDRLLENNARYAASFTGGELSVTPTARIAVITCMDPRMDVHQILGLGLGEAHVIRNAGGVVTDDELRSLVISQRLLGTDAIVLIQHTDCGMTTFEEGEMKQEIEREIGSAPDYELRAFSDLDEGVRDGLRRIRSHPYIPHREDVRGFAYDVETGRLREVER